MRKCIIKALKMMTFLTAAVVVVVYASCTAATQNVQVTTGTDGNNEVAKTYFTKDTSSGFQAFLTDPEGNCATSRAAAADSDGTVTETDMFAGLWSTLTEEEKEMVLESPEKASVSCDSSIAVDADSATGRAALDGDNTKLEDLAILYEYTAKLQDWFGDRELPLSLVPDSIPDCTASVLPAAGIFDKYIREGNWDAVDSFLAYLDYPVSLAVLQTEAARVNEATGSTGSERASSAVDFYDTPIRYNVGNTLKDGTVLLTVSKKKAYVVAGNWSHGGIFSLKQFNQNGKTDKCHCVYTAQPDSYSGFPEDMQPDRPGYTCLDTVYMYTKQRKFATLLPKNYSDSAAAAAVSTAKSVFYDPKPEYDLPWWEIFYIGNTSHDGSDAHTYCTKVVYTAWEKEGKNLDGNTFAGNLVTPDDIYGSSVNRYFTITITFLWWSKSWKIQTYAAASNLLTEESR
jgi:hypothetical protein